MNWWLLFIPLSTAFCSWLAIKLFLLVLFRPYNSTSVFGLRVQGIFPAHQPTIASQAGGFVATRLFSKKLIEEKIADPAVLQQIMPVIEEHIDDFLRNKLKKEMPFIGMFVGDKTVNSLKKVFMTELEALFPKIMRDYAGHLFQNLNIEQLVVEKIQAISAEEVEAGFRKNFSKRLTQAEMASALIGLFIGVVVMFVIFFIKQP